MAKSLAPRRSAVKNSTHARYPFGYLSSGIRLELHQQLLRMYVSDKCQKYKVCNSKLHAGKISSAVSLSVQIMHHKNPESRKKKQDCADEQRKA
eukprot:scaffold188982_cov20-Prasinocladus_malaysianus.AAC.1